MDKKQKKVLVVEDDSSMREVVVRKLTGAGLIVIEAAEGQQAIDLWQKEKPDLILLDLMLPEVDGFQVLETMRKNPDPVVANAPVIVLSNRFSKEDIQKTKDYSIEDFMVKAYHTTEEILSRVNEILQKHDQ